MENHVVSPAYVRLIRVFVSSPGDVQAEREVLDHVVGAINRTDGERDAFRLELFKWERNTVPHVGPSPQPAVDEQTPPYDIYLGIMSTRFGTPTETSGSGTKDEFETALDRWKAVGAPWIMFYFNAQPKLTGDVEQAKQYFKVCEFRTKLETLGLIAKYVDVETGNKAFRTQVDEHLRKVAQRLLPRRFVTSAVPAPGGRRCPSARSPPTAVTRG